MSWETPDTYHSGGCQAGDRHLNFHDDRDNLLGSLPWPRGGRTLARWRRARAARWRRARAACGLAGCVARQPWRAACVVRHHASCPQRVHLLGRGREEGGDSTAPHPAHLGGAGGRTTAALLLAGMPTPPAHRQVGPSPARRCDDRPASWPLAKTLGVIPSRVAGGNLTPRLLRNRT